MRLLINRIMASVLLLSFVGYLDARSVYTVQKDLQNVFRDVYKKFNICLKGASCSLIKNKVEALNIPDVDPTAIHIIFFNSQNGNSARKQVPSLENSQGVPVDVPFIQELIENASRLADTQAEKNFFSSLMECIKNHVDNNHCLILTVNNAMNYVNCFMHSRECEEYMVEKGNIEKYHEEIFKNTGKASYVGIEQANDTLSMISLLVFLYDQLQELPQVILG